MYKNIDFEAFLEALDSKILSVLEVNGFPLDDLGTYLYKDVIRNAVLRLMDCQRVSDLADCQGLIVSPYSSFYSDIAKFSLVCYGVVDVIDGDSDRFFLEEFHSMIRKTFYKTNIGKKRRNSENFHVSMALSFALFMLDIIRNSDENLQYVETKKYMRKPKFNNSGNICN